MRILPLFLLAGFAIGCLTAVYVPTTDQYIVCLMVGVALSILWLVAMPG